MTELGYTLSSEEHAPGELVHNAAHTEEAGFTHVYLPSDRAGADRR